MPHRDRRVIRDPIRDSYVFDPVPRVIKTRSICQNRSERWPGVVELGQNDLVFRHNLTYGSVVFY